MNDSRKPVPVYGAMIGGGIAAGGAMFFLLSVAGAEYVTFLVGVAAAFGVAFGCVYAERRNRER